MYILNNLHSELAHIISITKQECVLRSCISSAGWQKNHPQCILYGTSVLFKWVPTVNLLVAILMTYSIRLFYKHSTLKLWCKILVPQGIKLNFQHFRTRWLKYNIVLKLKIAFNLGLNTAKNMHYIEKSLKSKLFRIEFCRKKSANAYVYLLSEWSRRTQKIDMVEILYCPETANYIQFRTECRQKYTLHWRKLQIKVAYNWILYKKKICECICLPPLPQSWAGELEKWIGLKYYIILK